jgi:hypothetical protein
MSIALSGRRVPSHFQHRIEMLVPSTSATWRLSLNDGIVRPPNQALELLIEQDEWMLRLAHPLRHCAIFRRDEVDHCSG